MILLQYEIKAKVNLDNETVSETYPGINEYNLRDKLYDLACRIWLNDLSLQFFSGDWHCLDCDFSREIIRMESKILRHRNLEVEDSEYVEFFDDRIADRIKVELMAYERGKFAYREMEL